MDRRMTGDSIGRESRGKYLGLGGTDGRGVWRWRLWPPEFAVNVTIAVISKRDRLNTYLQGLRIYSQVATENYVFDYLLSRRSVRLMLETNLLRHVIHVIFKCTRKTLGGTVTFDVGLTPHKH